jgi:hypothetical protein
VPARHNAFGRENARENLKRFLKAALAALGYRIQGTRHYPRQLLEQGHLRAIGFDDVLQRLPTGHPDLLQIDTGGADAFILSLFPFEHVRPAIVHWEVQHLSKDQQENCLERLATFGYRFAASGDQDMMAVQP